jgi:hypothetical protein
MSTLPIQIDLAATTAGDKWQGIAAIGPVLINGLQPAFPLSRVKMQFRRGGRLGATFDSEPGDSYPITISNAETWLAHVPEVQPLPLEAGSWQWDMEFFTGSDTAPLTYYRGILTVLPEITK